MPAIGSMYTMVPAEVSIEQQKQERIVDITPMTTAFVDPMRDPRVARAVLPRAAHGSPYRGQSVAEALLRAGATLGWSDDERGPFARVVPAGAKVLIKPNLVLHANEGAGGIEPLITHPSVIQAVVDAILQTGPASVLVGDAPLQSCDFEHLLEVTRLGEWAKRLGDAEPRFRGIQDFRRTTCVIRRGVRVAEENLQPLDQFALFDLGPASLLESVTDEAASEFGAFRVTWYDPRLLARTHRPGRHQYLVARDILDADVVVNLPKLKTHKKAGITCALKNLIGINGNKEFLPHHRLGGAARGGDCYPGHSAVKRGLEFVADRQNLTTSYPAGFWWRGLTFVLHRVARATGDRFGYDGSWSGNDTIWRTCLDLNRILLYGRPDGTMADEPQRRVLHVVDGIVAGHGDGPLAPDPLPLGVILAGGNAAAVDWVGAGLLGYEPSRVHLVREAFSRFQWPVAPFGSDAVTVVAAGSGDASPVMDRTYRVVHPMGWRDAASSEGSPSAAPIGALSTASSWMQPDDG